MKKVFLFILVFLALNDLYAQSSNKWCATQLTDDMRDEFFARRVVNKARREAMKSASVMQYVPIKLHVVRRDDGTGGIELQNIWDNLCEMNETFNLHDIHFYVVPDINFIDNTDFYTWEYGGGEGDILMENYNVSKNVNCYFVGNVTGICGYAFFPGTGPSHSGVPNSEGGMVLINGCIGLGNSTWQHEMGHYMALAHTFEGYGGGWGFPENVARTGPNANCSFAGDGFCDTPADNMPDRWNCPYMGTELDANGDAYEPDPTLYMSYADDVCTNRFSDSEADAMMDALIGDRPYLLSFEAADPNLLPITESIVTYNPVSSAPSNYVEFKWNQVTNADFYILTAMRTSGSTIDKLIVTTIDTFYTAIDQFSFGNNYKWNVKPMQKANTCYLASPWVTFFANPPIIITPPSAIEENMGYDDFSIYPAINTNNEAFTIHWNNASYADAMITIYDAHGSMIDITHQPIGQGNTELNWNVAKASNGVYFIKINAGTLQAVRRVIIH